MSFPHEHALITGAASGIGRALALRLAGLGCAVSLVDVDEQGLAGTVAAIRDAAPEVAVSHHVADLTDPAAIAALPGVVGPVDLLINNAGAALAGRFDEVTAEEFDWIITLNFQSVVRMTRAFLPLLRQARQARIVNISSLYGLIAPPGQTAYAASKFAVRGFSEALRHELADTSVGVTTVHPGGIKTAIARNARIGMGASREAFEAALPEVEKLFITPPEDAAIAITDGVAAGRPRVLIGRDAKTLALFERLFPTTHMTMILKRLSPRKG